MAQKRINDLQLRSDFDATCNMPSDDLVQTWRITGAQILAYIQSNITVQLASIADGLITRAKLAAGAVARCAVTTVTGSHNATGANDVLLADSSGGNVTVNLPAAASHTGRILHIKKTSASNTVTVDANSTETIDGALTQVLTEQYHCLSIVSNGTEWSII
jgi:hypothetical protein